MTTQKQIEAIDAPLDTRLAGRPIRVTDAAEKYGVSQPTLSNWAKGGVVRVLERAPRKLILDEATVKRAVTMYNAAVEETSIYNAGRIIKRALEGQYMQ